MPGELRVDTAPLASGGQGLLSAAGDIPLPPVPFTASAETRCRQFSMRARRRSRLR